MICPACRHDMIVVEHNQIELDYCTNCHGVWFDSGELELLLKSVGLEVEDLLTTNLLGSPEVESSEKKRKCPICGQKMKKTSIGQQPEILIDACQRGHGMWFDGGEVAQLIKQLAGGPLGKTSSPQRVISFLREAFAGWE